MITILGTSHVSPESMRALKSAVRNKDCVCVELDPIRYHALLNKTTEKPPGLFPKVLHYMQQKIGRSTGVMPGEEMLEAVRLGRGSGLPVYLIDQDIRVTLARLKRVPLMEKLGILIPMLVSPKKFDMERVPSDRIVRAALSQMKNRAPAMHSVLVSERDAYMASWVSRSSVKHDNVLVVVGAAHATGLAKILKAEGHKVRVI